jgi:hypothetical protein
MTSDESASKETRTRSAPAPLPPGYLALWIIAVVSILLNSILIRQVVIARQVALQGLRDSIAIIGSLENQVIDYNVEIHENMPINVDIPINETVPIRINDDFPLETTVTVSVPAGPLGTIPVKVPISTTIPIDKTIEIGIDQTFTLTTTIPIDLSVPISLSIGNTGLAGTLEDTKARLLLLEAQLNRPLLPFLGDGSEPTALPEATEVP